MPSTSQNPGPSYVLKCDLLVLPDLRSRKYLPFCSFSCFPQPRTHFVVEFHTSDSNPPLSSTAKSCLALLQRPFHPCVSSAVLFGHTLCTPCPRHCVRRRVWSRALASAGFHCGERASGGMGSTPFFASHRTLVVRLSGRHDRGHVTPWPRSSQSSVVF